MLKRPVFDDLPGDTDGLLFRMNQELTCPICLCLFTQCTSTPCGHTYCHQCITQSLKTLSRCPICKETITKRGLSTSDSVEAIVREFLILRQHYEKDRGIILSQLPTREHLNNPREDICPQYPSSYTSTSTMKDNSPSETNIEPKTTEQLALLPESSTANQVPQSKNIGQVDLMDISETSSHHRHEMEVKEPSIPHEKSSEEQQQNDPSTLSLLLWPPSSPVTESSPNPLQPSSFSSQLESQPSSPQHSMPASSTNVLLNTSLNQPLVYTASQMDPFTASYLGKLHKDGKLKHTKEAHVSSKVTHFVFSTAGGRGIQNVTGPYLQALVLRKWIVNEQWVHQCYKFDSILDAAPYGTYYYGDGQEHYRNGPKRARRSAQNKKPPLFHHKAVYFDDSLDVKLKKQFTNLMIAGGGQVIQDPQDMTPSTMILAQSLSKKKDDRLVATLQNSYGKWPISIAWMTQSILRYELLNEEEFVIGTSKQ